MPSDPANALTTDALTTARLDLRRPTEHDEADLVALHADPAVMRFIEDGRPVAPAVARERDLPWLRAPYAPGRGYWAVHAREGGRFVGWFGLRPDPDDPTVLELGYRLTPAAWGYGYATEGARALVELAFTAGQATKVWATTMMVNTASRHVLAKVGLPLVRTFVADWPDPVPGSELGDVDHRLDVAGWRLRRGVTEPRHAPAPSNPRATRSSRSR